MFGPLRLVRALSDQQIEDMSDPRKAPHAGLPTIEEAIDKGGVLCGSPDQIIEHLKKLEERYPGLDRVSVSLSVGVPKTAVLEQLERFATEVMPAFKPVEKEAALAD
jgi:alkanesulfonate monooxygenase SsuD/methylene tetrahydromethanopterin reductase-like flavin-dependent oxidoreductase (luciferase family)